MSRRRSLRRSSGERRCRRRDEGGLIARRRQVKGSDELVHRICRTGTPAGGRMGSTGDREPGRVREDTQELAGDRGRHIGVEVAAHDERRHARHRCSLRHSRTEAIRGGPQQAVVGEEVLGPGPWAERREGSRSEARERGLVLRAPDGHRIRSLPDEVLVVAEHRRVVARGVLGGVGRLEGEQLCLAGEPEHRCRVAAVERLRRGGELTLVEDVGGDGDEAVLVGHDLAPTQVGDVDGAFERVPAQGGGEACEGGVGPGLGSRASRGAPAVNGRDARHRRWDVLTPGPRVAGVDRGCSRIDDHGVQVIGESHGVGGQEVTGVRQPVDADLLVAECAPHGVEVLGDVTAPVAVGVGTELSAAPTDGSKGDARVEGEVADDLLQSWTVDRVRLSGTAVVDDDEIALLRQVAGDELQEPAVGNVGDPRPTVAREEGVVGRRCGVAVGQHRERKIERAPVRLAPVDRNAHAAAQPDRVFGAGLERGPRRRREHGRRRGTLAGGLGGIVPALSAGSALLYCCQVGCVPRWSDPATTGMVVRVIDRTAAHPAASAALARMSAPRVNAPGFAVVRPPGTVSYPDTSATGAKPLLEHGQE